ncbi:unnamed protein product [Rotaria sp. Silwood1]|nr:unnamed protein product [Rotaria sp. Silwood1]
MRIYQFLKERYFYTRHKTLHRHQRPARIFLVRHGESQANVDLTLYGRMANHEVELTKKGCEQAIEAGKKLHSLIGKESVYVYMGQYKRSKETWSYIRKSFSPLQIITDREDSRLREQEFGNLSDLTKLPEVIQERDRLGHFFLSFFMW